jgi:hypothetical protein
MEKMEKIRNTLLILLLTLSFLLPAIAFSQEKEENFKIEIAKETYSIGEDITVNFFVSNPTNERVNFTCILVFDPPTSKNPMCLTRDVTLGPGEHRVILITQTVELLGKSNAIAKILNENENILIERKIPVEITPERTPTPEQIKKTICGDGKCDETENFVRCPKDCPSGVADGYCDRVYDGICDPDCSPAQDEDCKEKFNLENYFLYIGGILLGVIFLVFVFIIIRKFREKSKSIEQEREEFKKWQEIRKRLISGERPEKLKEEGFNPDMVDEVLETL